MSPHSSLRFVKYQRPKTRWAMGCVAALLCVSTMLPVAAHAQTLLPVVIKLPPSFLRTTPAAKLDVLAQQEVAKELGSATAAISQIAALRKAEVRSSQLLGMLPHQFDRHFYALEATEPGGAFAVTMLVEPASVLDEKAVNFVVLDEAGMSKYLAGGDPVAHKTAMGSPLLFDQLGNRLTALVPGSTETKYTLVVFNNGKLPVTYTLQVQGGVLVDDGGQSYSALQVGAPLVEAAAQKANQEAAQGTTEVTTAATTLAKYEGVIKRLGIAKRSGPTLLERLMPEQVRARQMSGVLKNWQDRHFLNLATNTGGGEMILTLRYESDGGVPTHLGFWVMTQDGARHLVQGGLAQELNLAMGLPVAGQPGVYQARLRMAENMLYTVVVFSEGMSAADYTLAVQGGILVDRYGQTRESHAAEMEALALASN